MGQKISHKMTAASGNDAAPVLSIFLEAIALKRIDLVTDETCDLHRFPHCARRMCIATGRQRHAARKHSDEGFAAIELNGQ
jgi:hypothetical protein